ncbi:MAG: transposase [Candidatus Vogelbacteria bacterium]|nr:transposase [Candidatus Vogelbacteria bacterium]
MARLTRAEFANDEYYHVYNRGTDKRDIFTDSYDLNRFYESLAQFNTVKPIGSIYEQTFSKRKSRPDNSLVEIVCYALNPNHYHLLLKQVSDRGIEKFIQRLGTGYTKYFNHKHKRSGVLFQGKFKSIHVETNEYLLHLSIYINLNDRVHQLVGQLGSPTSKLMKGRTSLREYATYSTNSIVGICSPAIILGQFSNYVEYLSLANDVLPQILEQKKNLKELETLFLE